MRKFGFLMLLIFWQGTLQANVSIADSLLNIIRQAPADENLFEEVYQYISQSMYNDPETAIRQSNEAVKLAKSSRNFYQMARFSLLTGIAYDLSGKYDSAFSMYDKCLLIIEKHELDQLKGDLFNNYSISLSVVGRLEESIEFALKAMGIFESVGDSAQLARIYNNLASRYSEIRFTDQALEYYLKAAHINEQREDHRRLAYNYGNIGLIYHWLNQHDKAMDFFYSSISLIDTVQHRYDFSIALHNLALAHQGLENHPTALRYEERALNIAVELGDELGIMNALTGMAQIHKSNNQDRKALNYYDQAEKMAETLGASSYLLNIYEAKTSIYANLNDYHKAFEFNKLFLAIKDSVQTVERDKAMDMLKGFENERKEKEIQLLTMDAEIQKLNVKRQILIRNSMAIVGFLMLLLAIGLFNRYRYVRKTRNELSEKNKIINYEKTRSDNLLLNILPAETAEELKNTGTSEARHFDMVTVMFTDFKGFTHMAEKLSATELVSEIDHYFKTFDQIVSKHGIEKIKTIGDAYMCAGGLPVANDTNPVDVVNAAIEIQQFMAEIKEEKIRQNKPFFELRLGIHTGPVVAGIVGIKKFQYDIWGNSVNIAARMESSGEVGKVNISQMTYEKVKHKFNCVYRGKIEAKNKGAIDMYFVEY